MGGAHMCSVPQNTLSRLFAISSYDSGCPRTLGRAVRSAMHGDQCEQTTVRGGFACRSCPWALVPRSRACAARLITCDQIHEMRELTSWITVPHTHTHTRYVFMSYHDSMPWQRARGVEQCGRGGGGWRVAGGGCGWRSHGWQCSARTTRASGDKLSATRDGLRIAEDDALSSSSSSSSSSCLLSPPAGAPPTRVASVHAACAQIIHGGGNHPRRRARQHMAAWLLFIAMISDGGGPGATCCLAAPRRAPSTNARSSPIARRRARSSACTCSASSLRPQTTPRHRHARCQPPPRAATPRVSRGASPGAAAG
jgi:hypothetical protein